MSDRFYVSPPHGQNSLYSPGERVLWRGYCAVAEYAFEQPASLPRWTLPEETEVLITDERVIYRDPITMGTGELRWLWPQHLRVQPGNRDTGRAATVTQIQLVCAGPAETYPALVFAGGELTTVSEADRLANLLRQAIARYRVEHAAQLSLRAPEVRMLSRLVIGPEFSNYQGGEGQTVSLLGAVPVAEPRAQELPPQEHPASAPGEQTVALRLTPAAPPVRHHPDPADLASRAADLAARVAMLVSEANDLEYETRSLSSPDEPPVEADLASRAESIRRTAARLAGNAPRRRSSLPQPRTRQS